VVPAAEQVMTPKQRESGVEVAVGIFALCAKFPPRLVSNGTCFLHSLTAVAPIPAVVAAPMLTVMVEGQPIVTFASA